VLHCILSFIGNLRGQDAGASLASAVKQAKTQYPFVDDFQELQATVSALLGGKELRRYFWVEESEVFTEKDVVDSSGNTRRIDRLIVSQDEVLVIDYKSTRTSTDEYRMQVGEYLRIVRDIYPTRACRGILIYLDDLSSEEVA